MNKSKIILYTFFGLSIIVKVLDSLAHFFTGTFNYEMIGYALYSLCIILALVFAMIAGKYLVMVFISILKIGVVVGGPLLGQLFVPITLSLFAITNGILAVITLLIGFFLVYDFFRMHHYNTEAPTFVAILGPFTVLLFFSIFHDYEMGVLVALTEIIALILVAHVSEDLLWVGAFIVVPFNFMQAVVDNAVTFKMKMYVIIGSIILIAAIASLIVNIKHFIYEQKEYRRRIEELHERLEEKRKRRRKELTTIQKD